MNFVLIALAVLAFVHGIRDVLQYYGRKNFLTEFLHFYGDKRLELPSAIISFSIAVLLFLAGLLLS